MIFKKWFLFFLVSISFSFSFIWVSYIQPQNLEVDTSSEAKITNPYVHQWIDESFDKIGKLLKNSKVPGTAVSIVYGDQVFIRTFGVRSVKSQQPIDQHSVFRIASLSKSFAAVLTARLVKENKLRWNNHVKDYLPEFQLSDNEQTDRIQLWHLLSHTTGLPYHTYTNLVEAGIPTSKIISELKSVDLVGSEGSVYSYQNAPFSIIGEVHRVATGQTYEQLLKEKIFSPLGMSDASTDRAAITSRTNTAQPHNETKTGWYQTKISDKYYSAVPAGGVNASINDMSTYLRLLLGQFPGLLTAEDLAPIFEPVISTPIKRRYFGKWPKLKSASYGLGWRILDYAGTKVSYHSGYVNSYKGEMAVNHNEQIGFCLLMNGAGKEAKLTVPIFLDTYEKYKPMIKQWQP
jgi:Beta-lactamase class C and other penicillin binding proteins